MPITPNSTQDRALKLLMKDLPPSIVASTLGVTPAAISQYLADDEFSAALVAGKFEKLKAAANRSEMYDALEDTLLQKLKDSVSMLFDPLKIARILQTITASRPKISVAQEIPLETSRQVVLNMPTQVIQHFTTNIQNQVVKVGERDLTTVQSANMEELVRKAGIQNVETPLLARTKVVSASS